MNPELRERGYIPTKRLLEPSLARVVYKTLLLHAHIIGGLGALRARSRVAEADALLDPADLGGCRVLEWAGSAVAL
jgi:hypothetical protein